MKQKKLHWLVDQEQDTPFINREGYNYNKRFKNLKKTANSFLISAWFILALVMFTTAFTTLIYNSTNVTKSMTTCHKIFEELSLIVNESQIVIPSFKVNNIYDNVNLMQKYLNQSLNENCVKAVKVFTWMVRTPYNNQISPNYEITLLLQEIALLLHSCAILSFEMSFLTLLMFAKFQFETIKIDLVNIY